MTASGFSNARERWGQHPMCSATGYVHLSECPRCHRLSQRNPDRRSRLAEAERIPLEQEAEKLALFRANRRKLPRMYCLMCSTFDGVYSVLDEYHDAQTDALVGLIARYEQRGGREILFELRREDQRGDVLVAPIEQTRAVKSLLNWVGRHPLPAMGKIETQPTCDLIDEVIRYNELSASCCIRLDTRYTQRSEALYRLQPYPVWDSSLHLAATVVEEVGADPSVADVYAGVQSVIPALVQRHLVSR